jgi:type I restriction enzyme M protein
MNSENELKYTISDVLKGTDYALTIFDDQEKLAIKLFDRKGKPYLRDFVDSKERPAKPEEIVRQLFLYRLINTYQYPKDRIFVEKGVYFGSSIADKRADIVICEKENPDTAYIIVEVKKPKRQDGLEQLKSYCNAEGAPIAVWTNGGEVVILHREDPNLYRSIPNLPRANQTLVQVINEKVTIDDLSKRNKLVIERLSLRDVIKDLENLVLANAGVDQFEEVFKLIYAKLYDEAQAKRRPGRLVEFRASGETRQELYDKINGLFHAAKEKWQGVFLPGESIDLTPDHLAVCVSFLQDIKLFNSNLQVIDEAFEYLVTQVYKGSKGQYFTPRHVIDMCVKMLNPKWEEYMIDTAAGSCGFTVHTIFHVWGGEMTSDGPTKDQAEYASEMVYGLDFDARSVKVAKALNLIAGDGRTNVYRANTLDPRNWSEETRVALKKRLHRFETHADNEHNQKNFRYFDFDILMTNPPFAGDIADSKILYQYELAKKWKGIDIDALANPEERQKQGVKVAQKRYEETGSWYNKQSRDVLFIERNLEFLRPGGRMAIVLPQGRFNNISDAHVRAWISERARILAVVGLDVNTFKPHTGTKTSVLFLQKWNDDQKSPHYCPKIKDYPIFFATSEKSGKNNSGDYVFKPDDDGNPRLDAHGHLVIDHDLDEIAEAFIDFARQQNFSFLQEA